MEILWSYDATRRKLSKEVLRDSLKIDDNPIGDGKYYANWMSSEGTVAENSEVEFIAADSIVLLPGFSAKPNFTAKIGQNEGTIRHYVNGIEYFEGEMEAIYHEVGRVFFEGNGQTYEFTIADHLGNTRTVFKDDGGSVEVVQVNDYYAFGLSFEQQESSYGYTFGNKEEQNELGLVWSDFGARYLMKDIGRWISIDPLADEYTLFSPYSFSLNNPIVFNDPSGMAAESPIFDKEGNFLGTDTEGFKGDIVIMDKNDYDNWMKFESTVEGQDDDEMLDADLVGLMTDAGIAQTLDDYVANDFDISIKDDKDVLSNVFTNLISAANEAGLISYNISNLLLGKYGIDNDTESPRNAAAIWSNEYGKDRIMVLMKPGKNGDNFSFGYESGNAANAIHVLGVHEPLHRKFPGLRDGPRGHGGMYDLIYDTPEYRKTLKNITPKTMEIIRKWRDVQ